ncbi:hypothetical protein O163_06985 [Caldanaerobacter subterraneus subsp. yonseiensis KB-1]|uniref:C4-dicarboxylate ABC transporter n=1 Tax=Caldanaerobacter subterraneus subsp. yonseiensis KB-1 TaxID=1388761 RepID=U5CGQ2_CALSX|nr:hypothetical protein [Caldanaerobacter subterraneus]ERM92105.1 hypothetical protein O163_06985 [Caldanaerobacter subterraneus subsp. yonseiensis KB-1]
MELTASHIAYFIAILVILILLLMRKDIILPVIIAIFAIGLLATKDVIKAIQIIYTAILVSGIRLWHIIVIISLIIAMSKALDDIGADVILTKPFIRHLKSPTYSFWVIGLFMMLLSFFMWPAPAVGLIGTVLIIPSLKSGIDKVSLASIVSVFGFGIALSGDFFIQGAPSITAKAAGINTHQLVQNILPIWAVSSVVASVSLYFCVLYTSKHHPPSEYIETKPIHGRPVLFKSYTVSVIAVVLFLIDVLIMILFKIHSSGATALIGGTAIIVLIASAAIQENFLDKTRDYLREGFLNGMRTFAPVIIISAFFLLGETSMAKQVIGPHARGYLVELGTYLSHHIPLNKYTASLLELAMGILTGMSGSGFSGLPLIGALAKTFSSATSLNPGLLSSIGQLAAIWTGGGTLIPWSTAVVSAVIGVDSRKISKRNFIPAVLGLISAYIVTVILL